MVVAEVHFSKLNCGGVVTFTPFLKFLVFVGFFGFDVKHFLNASECTECALNARVGAEGLTQWAAHGEHEQDERD